MMDSFLRRLGVDTRPARNFPGIRWVPGKNQGNYTGQIDTTYGIAQCLNAFNNYDFAPFRLAPAGHPELGKAA
jgi:hypothetical protein